MPHLPSTYRPPLGFRWRHLQTCFPTLFRRVKTPSWRRERLETGDGDFLDLDWLQGGRSRLAVIAHGMEGSSHACYVAGMVRHLSERGWDCLAWNMRGCGGEVNRLVPFYHSGKTDDLEAVIGHVPEAYAKIALIGFSLGGNVVLKYLGERGEKADSRIRGCVTFSVPCDLQGCADSLSRRANAIYLRRFLRRFRHKVRLKMKLHPRGISDADFSRIRTMRDYDDRYTAPFFGYADAVEYWRANASLRFLPRIAVPTLLVNALDDPILSPGCYPYAEARANPWLFLETPADGGHTGFVTFGQGGAYWSEQRAAEFLEHTLDARHSGVHVTGTSPETSH